MQKETEGAHGACTSPSNLVSRCSLSITCAIAALAFSYFVERVAAEKSSSGVFSTADGATSPPTACWWNCSYSEESPQCCSFCGPGGEAVEGCCTKDSDCTSHGDSSGTSYCRKDTNWCDGCSAGYGGPLCQYAWATEPRDKCALSNGTTVTCPVERPYCDGKLGACYGEGREGDRIFMFVHLLPPFLLQANFSFLDTLPCTL